MSDGDVEGVELIQARNYTSRHGMARQVDLIVLHTMEAPGKPGTARSVARWFQGPHAPTASAHYCLDPEDTVQCVLEDDVAWAAPGANSNGIHLEHAGYAREPVLVWTSDDRMQELRQSATLGAGIAARHAVPLVWVSAEELVAGWKSGKPARGVTTHSEITKAGQLGGKTSPWAKNTHVDPGPSFPVDTWLELARAE